MSYRNKRKFKSESYDGMELEDDVVIGNPNDASLEVTGELLERDYKLISDLVDNPAIDEEGADTLVLVTESIAKRWGLDTRHITRESMSVYSGSGSDGSATTKEKGGVKKVLVGLMERFLEWFYDIGVYISSSLKKLTNVGNSALRDSSTYEGLLKKLADKGAEGSAKPIHLKNISGYFYTADKLTTSDKNNYSIKVFMSALNDVLADIGLKVDDWLKGNIVTVGNYVSAVASGDKLSAVKKGKPSREVGEVPLKLYDNIFFKKGTRSKLKPMGPVGSEEEQLVVALPGNAYLQIFSYNDKKGELDYNVTGARFLSPTLLDKLTLKDRRSDNYILVIEKTPSIRETLSAITILKKSAEEMIKLENSWGKVKREFDKTNKEAKKLLANLKSGKSDIDPDSVKITHTLTREAAMTNKAMYNYKSYLVKTNIALCKSFLSATMTEYNIQTR